MATILRTPDAWTRITLARAGAYDPEAGLAAAERAGAWSAWKRAMDESAHDDAPGVLARLVDEAGLSGRGGAGYPAASRWRTCRSTPASARYAVANGYEADPGAAINRVLMEMDPHAVVEGLALAAYAVGAREAFLAVRAEFTLAADRLRAAVAQAEDAGYLGLDPLGRGFELHIEVRPVQGAAILGEETALLRALEGRRAMPDQRPPHPETKGLFGRPTLVQDVETLAAVPWVILNGAEAFAAAGRDGATGTKLVQVSGAVRTPGIAEVPLGIPLREIIDQVGGGAVPGHEIKAVLVGGPAGGFLPPDALDTPLDYDALRAAGAILGSGTLVVLDQRACIVDVGRLMARFMSDEACGKCIPCRIGARRLYEIADRFVTGRSRPNDQHLLLDLSADVRDASLCAHGINSPNPLTSGMRHFASEYEAHIRDGVCAAGVCRPLRVVAGPASAAAGEAIGR
jgi:NADH:ubiquinone oxidoreductase subunit F (NADH-binding)